MAKFEINQEALEALSVADLSNIITMIKLYPRSIKNSKEVLPVLTHALQKKLDNIFIF